MPARSAGRSPSPSRQGLFSRIRAPFSQKARHVSEFYVQPDDPHRQYGPGDVVTGSVVLKVAKPLDITHVVVCLHGFAQVYKSPNNPGEGYRNYNAALIAGKTNKAGGYYGNGFASLFEDEIILCGDGRLGEGTYQFNFELNFPREHSPTGIDFERGTITHMITSTLTRPFRPTIMNPTTSCERRISFADDIDIAPLVQPKPRIITLEPIIRRSKTRSRRKAPSTLENHDQFSVGITEAPGRPGRSGRSRATDSSSGHGDADPPRSPVMSEVSLEDSTVSSMGAPSAADSATQSAATNGSRIISNAARQHSARRPITAAVELQRAGFLRGDSIEIKIHINHTKQIKSLHGIIVTLYRQARVDMHPGLPIATGRGEEDIYTRSRTGLAGLSLSAAGSCHLFRKDLDQSFASLIINPDTLRAEIKTSVRVPEDAFPTVSTVPGAMISFKYHVEVILDLQGKLTGLDKILPTPGISSAAASFRGGSGVGSPQAGMFVPWGGQCINTEDIRREKSVVSCNFEVVIGTRDSERSGQWRDLPMSADMGTNNNTEQPDAVIEVSSPEEQHAQHEIAEPPTPYNNVPGIRHQYQSQEHFQSRAPDYEGLPLSNTPLPDVSDEGELSEKERLRRAEQRLLPSSPNAVPESSASASHVPSAPTLPDLEGPQHISTQNEPVFNFGLSSAPHTTPSAPYLEPAGSSAPAYDQHSPPPHATHSDDKQELVRRQLETERSAPEMPNELAAGAEPGPSAPPATPSTADFAPSAPNLSDEDAFIFNAPASHHSLPRYER